jgi:hypothetical protein
LKGKTFIYNANEADRDFYNGLVNGELVTETHGRNDLRKYTCAVYLSSRNLHGLEGSLVAQAGIPRNDIDVARGVLAGYQFFMRTALRDSKSMEPIHIYCADSRMVDFMLKTFPYAIVRKHAASLQIKNLDDGREVNGGAREGAGRRPIYPGYFTEADKKRYKRAMHKLTNGVPSPSPSEWFAT